MGCLSGKALQGKQLAVKRRFKQAVVPAHLARLRLQKDARVERGNQTSKTVSCGPGPQEPGGSFPRASTGSAGGGEVGAAVSPRPARCSSGSR